MTAKTQRLSIRLLRDDCQLDNSVREGVELLDWPNLDGAKIALDTLGGNTPKWAEFLELSAPERGRLVNKSAVGVLFVQAAGRWFAVSFGLGHVKLDPSKFVADFGLRVVLNAVDPKQLRSADLRTPDENTLARRTQTSRGSDQTAFAIDAERDIVRGLAGIPKDASFAVRVSGADSLTMERKLTLSQLPTACAEAYAVYQKRDYQADFGWIDQIRHERDTSIVKQLDSLLAQALARSLSGTVDEHLNLAYPIIYDPNKHARIRFKGYRSKQHFPTMEIADYLRDLAGAGTTEYHTDDLQKHSVHEVDEDGKDCGEHWKIHDCLVYEAIIGSKQYVLSAGKWYQIDQDLANQVLAFFNNAPRKALPVANIGETEVAYNKRLRGSDARFLCMDARMVRPSGAASDIEVCDFLSRDKWLIHVKDKSTSSRLSHLFSQGTVSARVLKADGAFRDKAISKAQEVERETRQSGFSSLLPPATAALDSKDWTVVFGVLVEAANPRLPFFSLVTFRQAARELEALGYRYAFAWIRKAGVAAGGTSTSSSTGNAAIDESPNPPLAAVPFGA